MRVKLVEPVSPKSVVSGGGKPLYHVRPIPENSPKHQALMELLATKKCTEFLQLGEWLLNYLKNSGFPSQAQQTMEHPLYLMTDFTDPRPLKGLRLETGEETIDLPDLYFLGFYTDWDNLSESGVDRIFGHEYAHLWFFLLNYQPSSTRSNMFHTSTAKTDVFTAFFEGFAEHLQIVAQEQSGSPRNPEEIWDSALDVNAWLSYRDEQLRYYAVKNNRFVYHTALPEPGDFAHYSHLHMAHITSSAFTPERVKNGSQIIASEGAVATVFYRIYRSDVFRNRYCSEEFYQTFGTRRADVSPFQNLYLKILYALSKTDLTSPQLFIEFIQVYAECFPAEHQELFKLFLQLTHYTTVSHQAARLFGELYQLGRRGIISSFDAKYREVLSFKEQVFLEVMQSKRPLNNAIYPEIWVTGHKQVPPVPWEPDRLVPYRFDLNAATEVDFLSVRDMDLEQARAIIRRRDENRGFKTLEEFQTEFPGLLD